MTILEITNLMAEPEKLLDPKEMVTVNQYVSEFISYYEDMIYEQKIRVSEEWIGLRKLNKSDKITDMLQLGMEQHRKLDELERIHDRLRRYRSDLKSKVDIIMRTKPYYG